MSDMTSDDLAAGANALDRERVSGIAARTRARRQQVAAEAAAASLSAPAIERVTDSGGEAAIWLRDGAIADIYVPGMGRVATIKAGDGWGSAIISPRLLPAGPPAEPADAAPGGADAMTPGSVQPYVPNGYLRMYAEPLAPAGWASRTEALIRALHPDREPAAVHEEVYRIWREMCGKT